MDELNNKQMILLTMFTSFVVSIATGIITVATLEETPQTLTQTVNRVVERTIERVVTGSSTPERPTPAPIITNITKEVTVYAKEDDLVIAAVEKNQPRIVRIYAADTATSSDPLAIGFVISRDGLIVTESKSLLGDEPAKESYRIMLGEKYYSAALTSQQDDSATPVSFLKIGNISEGQTFDAVSFGRAGEQKLAQTVVVLGGTEGDGVFKTTLSKLRYVKSDATGTPQILNGIETLPKIPDENLGGLVVNLDGQAVGMVISGNELMKYIIYPVSRLIELVGSSQEASSDKTHNQSAIVSASGV
jgi:S1-C subfamily serine protease